MQQLMQAMFASEADEESRAAELAALRRQKLVGQLGMLSSVPGIGETGAATYKSAESTLNPRRSQFDDMMKMMALQNTMQNQQANRELRELQLQAQAAERMTRSEEREAARDAKAQENLYRDVQRLEKTIPDSLKALGSTLMELKGELSQYEADPQGRLNLPGYGQIEGWLPGIAVGDKGRRLRGVIGSLRNQLLAAQSGAAVSESEAARLYEELNIAENASREEEIVASLDRFRRRYEEMMARKHSTVPPAAIEQYYGGQPPVIGPLHRSLGRATLDDVQEVR